MRGESRLRRFGCWLVGLVEYGSRTGMESKLYKDWAIAEYEIERLREGLRQIVERDYPSDAGGNRA